MKENYELIDNEERHQYEFHIKAIRSQNRVYKK